MSLLITGGILCILMIFAWVFYFSPKRKKKIEQPKYDMMSDYEEPPSNKKKKAAEKEEGEDK